MKDFVNSYVDYLRNNLKVNKLINSNEIILPFYDRYGDSIVCYVDEINEKNYYITDDGYTINNLLDSGLTLTPKRLDTIKLICMGYGIKLVNNELQTDSSLDDLPKKVNNLAMAMLKIDDMYVMNSSRVISYFLEDVQSYFDKNDIYYSKNVSFTGRSGFTQQFDFSFQRNKNNSERLCKVINKINSDNVQSTMFAWSDIKGTRDDSTKCIVVLNDRESFKNDILSGFKSYDITPVPWSMIDDYKQLFI